MRGSPRISCASEVDEWRAHRETVSSRRRFTRRCGTGTDRSLIPAVGRDLAVPLALGSRARHVLGRVGAVELALPVRHHGLAPPASEAGTEVAELRARASHGGSAPSGPPGGRVTRWK